MYKIGEFSKITNLTVKALRYYDVEGIYTKQSWIISKRTICTVSFHTGKFILKDLG